MSASVTNPPAPSESKSAKKKRAKSEISASTSAAVTSPNPSTPTAEAATNGAGGVHEPAFMKELHKSLRNAVKKLNATAKVDAIVAENPENSLDELVALKKINPDQKAQILKKPALQASIAQIEEQLNQYKQYGAYYEDRLASQKAELEKAHKEELEAVKEAAAAKQATAAETLESAEKDFREKLLVLSRFLRAAAAMRRSGDETSNDSRAFEGALFQVYGGTDEAVTAMVKLIDGAEENVPSVDAEPLEVQYSRVKQASLDYIPPAAEAGWTEETQAVEAAAAADSAATDPTVANAGLTELQDTSLLTQQAATTNGYPVSETTQPQELSAAPSQSAVSNDTANPMAQSSWDSQASNPMAASTTAEGWVEVQKTEVETQAQGVPPTLPTSDSWAEDIPVLTPATEGAPEPNDGFKPVVNHTRQNSGRGRGFRGRGPRGEGFRGRGGFRGDRGEYRGRGRGRGGEYRGRGRGGFAPQAPQPQGESPA